MTDTSSTRPAVNPAGFRASPNGHIYGIVDDPKRDIPLVMADLLASGIPIDGIHIYCCSEGAETFDLMGTRHGLRARINRLVQSVAYEDDHLKRIDAELEAGHALIGVAVDSEGKGEVSKVLHRHGGHDVVYYGDYVWQRLGQK